MKRIVFIALLLLCWVLPSTAFAADAKVRIVIEGDVLVDRGQTTKDVYVADGDVTVRGRVDGDIVVGDGDVTIRGDVTGDVLTFGGRATLGRRAHVEGDLRYGQDKPVVSPGARVDGDVKKLKPDDVGGGVLSFALAVWVAVTVSMLLLGLILLLLFPRAGEAAARVGRTRKGRALLVGLLTLIVIPVIGVLALITVIGIPLGATLLLLMLPLWAISYVTGSLVVGRMIKKTGGALLAFIIGLVIVRVLALVPFLGGLVSFLTALLGLGALVVAARTR
jgi:cytoskeletal protein CcmA (bactofilin family)